MAINDFASLIQLMATISVAFVAVESVNSYTVVACEKILGLYNFVKSSLDECRSILVDKQTIDLLRPVTLNGQDTNTVIEATKRRRESICKEIDDAEKNMKGEVQDVCKARSMSSLCFFIFLSNILLLFIGGLENLHPVFTHVFVSAFCILVIVYLLLGWLLGENEKPKWFSNFSSLWHPTLSWIIIVVLSTVLCFVFKDKEWVMAYIAPYWYYALITIILSSYLDFVVFVLVMRNKAKKLKDKVKTEKEGLKKNCEDLNTQVNDLLGTERVGAVLAADS